MNYHIQPQATPEATGQALLLESKDYWCRRRGSEDPPPPSLRMVNGKQRLGRYVDPYGAQGLMMEAKVHWQERLVPILIAAGAGAVFCGVDAVFVFLALPFWASMYLVVRRKYQRRYDRYYKVLQQIEATDEPVWVPYDKYRLQHIDRSPAAVWP
jgi:hypothetical protein